MKSVRNPIVPGSNVTNHCLASVQPAALSRFFALQDDDTGRQQKLTHGSSGIWSCESRRCHGAKLKAGAMTAPILALAAFCIIATVAHVASIVIAMLRLRRPKHGKSHRQPNDLRAMAVEPLDAVKASMFAERFQYQYITTIRGPLRCGWIHPGASDRSPLSMRSNGNSCAIRSWILMFFSIHQSTISGTSVRPRAPPNAVSFRPGRSPVGIAGC